MHVVVVDGQGGKLGAQIIKEIVSQFELVEITAVGTNAVATANMLKAGAHQGATGENPVIVACRSADVIIGPVGIVIADSLLGEVTPNMAMAIGQADAVRILIPVNKCNNLVAGVNSGNISVLVSDAIEKLKDVYKLY
ncbi:MAG: DUF3842 family protein [Clostridia bacterium]|nr:DUF3842 family protein [Clostridia bacterium]